MPETFFIGRVVDIPGWQQGHVLLPVGVPQNLFVDSVVDIPVVLESPVPAVQTVQKSRSSHRSSSLATWGHARCCAQTRADGAGAATEDGVIVSLLASTRRHLQCFEWYSSSSEELCCATGMGILAWSLYGET